MLLGVVAALSASFAVWQAWPEGTAPEPAPAQQTTFEDSTREAAASGDIERVTVSNDRLGVLEFEVALAAELRDGSTVLVFIDSDRNATTGARAHHGADHAYVVSDVRRNKGGHRFDFSLARWDGARFIQVYHGSTSSGQPRLTFALDSYELGRTSGFNFAVATSHGNRPVERDLSEPVPVDVDLPAVDQAPDAGKARWRFDMKVTPVEVSVADFTTKPEAPKAGQRVYATTIVEASAAGDLSEALDGSCDATVDGKPLLVGYSLTLGDVGEAFTKVRAECEWDVPHDGVGKLFRGWVKLSFRGKSLTRSFAATITR